MSNFLDNLYGVLFSPKETFDKLIADPPLFQGFLIVVFVGMLSALINPHLYNGIKGLLIFGFQILTSAFSVVISWLFFASFIEITASVFKQSGKIKEFLTVTAFALLPWIFIAPINLLKTGGVFGGISAVLLGLSIWLWTSVLIIIALIKTYNLSFSRSIILIVIPFFGGFLAFNWTTGFFITLYKILSPI